MNFVIAMKLQSSLSITVQQTKLKGLRVVNNKAPKIEAPDILKY